MTKLIECSNEIFSRGTVFRARGKYPYEEIVDFMVFDTLDENRRFGLMVTTGYKAGLPLVCLPDESNAGGLGLSKAWVLANWGKWIYPDCKVSQVLVINSYKPGSHSLAEVQELPFGNLQNMPPHK
ncbi:Imm45 family immunity protein [Pseudomonas sp. 2835]|uniref:Imm45 family immunity protein n=1 Tax=Pseudomonas sp. 2835 TaxID=3156451 RepID=UPI003D212FBF